MTEAPQTNDDQKSNGAPASDFRKRNALVHGFYASDVILPGEDEGDFEKLHADLKAELDPHGRTEEETVLEIGRLWQQKRRLVRLQRESFNPTLPVENTSGNTESEVQKGNKTLVDVRQKLMTELDDAHARVVKALSEPSLDADSKQCLTDANADLQRMVSLMLHCFGRAPAESRIETSPESKEVSRESPITDHLTKIFRLEASIDARIDKNLGRLVSLKEYKRLEASKRIESKTIKELMTVSE